MRMLANVLTVVVTLGFMAPSQADDYTAEWAPPIGSEIPAIDAQDHTGQARNFANLAGDNGLLIFLNRSADW